MKKSRINSDALYSKRPLKIKPNHGLIIILFRIRVEKLMNMNEQPEKQLAEPKEERGSRNRETHSLKLDNMLLPTR